MREPDGRFSCGVRVAFVVGDFLGDLAGQPVETVEAVVEPLEPLQECGVALIQGVEAIEELFLTLVESPQSGPRTLDHSRVGSSGRHSGTTLSARVSAQGTRLSRTSRDPRATAKVRSLPAG